MLDQKAKKALETSEEYTFKFISVVDLSETVECRVTIALIDGQDAWFVAASFNFAGKHDKKFSTKTFQKLKLEIHQRLEEKIRAMASVTAGTHEAGIPEASFQAAGNRTVGHQAASIRLGSTHIQPGFLCHKKKVQFGQVGFQFDQAWSSNGLPPAYGKGRARNSWEQAEKAK